MTGCVESGSSLAYRQLDAALEALTPAVSQLLERAVVGATPTWESDASGYRFVAPLRFPDGIGRGAVVARLFRYRDKVRIDIEVTHNRVFARSDSTPSDRRCYLNDFIASDTMSADANELSPDFIRDVIRGIRLAQDGVKRHNRDQVAPWARVTVVALAD
jgi:hypothetical protein